MTLAPRLTCRACGAAIPARDVDGPTVACRRCRRVARLDEVVCDA